MLGENLTIFSYVKKRDNCILYFNSCSYVTYDYVGEELYREQKRKQRNSCSPSPEFYERHKTGPKMIFLVLAAGRCFFPNVFTRCLSDKEKNQHTSAGSARNFERPKTK